MFLCPAASKRRVPRWPPSTKRIRRAGWGRRFWALWGKSHSNGQNRNPDLANRQEASLRCRDRRESRSRRRKSPPQPPGTIPPAPDPGLSRPQCCPGGSSPQFRKGISTKTDSNGLDGQLAKKSFKVTGQIQIIAPSHFQNNILLNRCLRHIKTNPDTVAVFAISHIHWFGSASYKHGYSDQSKDIDI